MTAKPFLPIDDQVRLLKQRGLTVDDNTSHSDERGLLLDC